MKNSFGKKLAAIFAVGVVSSYAGAVTLKERVAADFEGMSGDFYHYAVPPMSSVQRLADVYPVDGTPGGSVNIVAARDEFEPGSFLVWANTFRPTSPRTACGTLLSTPLQCPKMCTP